MCNSTKTNKHGYLEFHNNWIKTWQDVSCVLACSLTEAPVIENQQTSLDNCKYTCALVCKRLCFVCIWKSAGYRTYRLVGQSPLCRESIHSHCVRGFLFVFAQMYVRMWLSMHACVHREQLLTRWRIWLHEIAGKLNLIRGTLLTLYNFKEEEGMFVIEGMMIIWTPQDFTGVKHKRPKKSCLMLLARFGWNCMSFMLTLVSCTPFNVNSVADTVWQLPTNLTDCGYKYAPFFFTGTIPTSEPVHRQILSSCILLNLYGCELTAIVVLHCSGLTLCKT